MQSQTSDNSGFNKLKSILFLGLSCNRTSLVGCFIAWILLSQDELDSFWGKIIAVFCVLPFFMGDAVNSYVLGRIRLEYKNDWDDIRMANSTKAHISKFYNLYRAISILSAYGIAYIMLLLIQKKPYNDFLLPIAVIAVIHYLLALITIIKGIFPVIHSEKKGSFFFRIIFVPALCFVILTIKNPTEYVSTHFMVFALGMLYFIGCGMMHPLPANGSIFDSIIRDSIISQAQAVAKARARATQNSQIVNYGQKDNIEDASIVETEEKKETVASNSSDESDGILPDAIIDNSYSYSDNYKDEKIDESYAEIISVEKANTEVKN